MLLFQMHDKAQRWRCCSAVHITTQLGSGSDNRTDLIARTNQAADTGQEAMQYGKVEYDCHLSTNVTATSNNAPCAHDRMTGSAPANTQ